MTISAKEKQMIGFTNLTDRDVLDIDDIYGAQHYRRLQTIIRKMQGTWLYTRDDRKIIDCLAAYSSANAGHHHPKIVRALVDAMQKGYGSVISNVVYSDSRSEFLKRVCEFLPQLGPRFGDNGNKALSKNGGVESVETAIKLARFYGYKEKGIPDGKQEIIVYGNNFHGRMITVVSFSSSKDYRAGFGPLTPGFKEAPYGDLDATEKLITDNTCGILVEPMQGEGGMYIPSDNFLKGLRDLADKHNFLLLFDEIQVGMGRTGRNFCFEHYNVIPDAVIIGKAIGGGLVPLSVMLTNRHLMDLTFTPGKDGSTFGGYPLACIAGVAALDVMQSEKLAQKSEATGKMLRAKIDDIASRSGHVKEVRGRGLFIGIEVKSGDAMVYCRKLLDMDMLANDSHGHTIRISPPLIINEDEVNYIAERLEKVLVD